MDSAVKTAIAELINEERTRLLPEDDVGSSRAEITGRVVHLTTGPANWLRIPGCPGFATTRRSPGTVRLLVAADTDSEVIFRVIFAL